MSAATQDDPYIWLEDVTGEKPMQWVKEQNARTAKELAGSDQFKTLQSDILKIMDSDAKIPVVTKQGDYYYNFWKDKTNERGLWRRTTLEEYKKKNPKWEVLLDLDKLNKQENENWVWHGANCLKPDYTRCLIALSRGGADADVTREFDLGTKAWVKDGFSRPEAKGAMTWIDKDTVFVFTDFGPRSMTSSGYPRIVKQLKRGQKLDQAEVVYEGKSEDMYISGMHDDTTGYERDFISRTLAFYNDELYERDKASGRLIKIDAPNSANKSVHRDWLTLELREPWEVKGTTYPAGALLITNYDDFKQGKRDFQVIFTPTKSQSLASYDWTKNYLVVNTLDDVKNKLYAYRLENGQWKGAALADAPNIDSVNMMAVDDEDNDALWVTGSDYLTPTTLSYVDIGKGAEALKSNPAFFNASDLVSEQKFATSKDGTKIPYFIVHKKDMKLDGKNPTLLYGYGGFEIALTPSYNATVGKAWLEQGGVYVVANIRGGGEYGPAWHQAALKKNRHKAYEDFSAVAKDLIANKVTSNQHIAAQGGSNGGLLAGNMLTQYPELFKAIVIQVPLLDMKRYNQLLAGASWMAEYGNPDTPDWNYIKTFSPYQLFDPKKDYPATFIWTTTRDDRVHPGHARKMAARMQEANKNVRYFENTEGGHGAGATNTQAAYTSALNYQFLWDQLK